LWRGIAVTRVNPIGVVRVNAIGVTSARTTRVIDASLVYAKMIGVTWKVDGIWTANVTGLPRSFHRATGFKRETNVAELAG
jgi:hypothetical protein